MAKAWVRLAAETRKRQSKLDDERKLIGAPTEADARNTGNSITG
jgi:hypothetical protein